MLGECSSALRGHLESFAVVAERKVAPHGVSIRALDEGVERDDRLGASNRTLERPLFCRRLGVDVQRDRSKKLPFGLKFVGPGPCNSAQEWIRQRAVSSACSIRPHLSRAAVPGLSAEFADALQIHLDPLGKCQS